jgi:hypothetical protein
VDERGWMDGIGWTNVDGCWIEQNRTNSDCANNGVAKQFVSASSATMTCKKKKKSFSFTSCLF